MMALSPDGQRLAYTTRSGGDLAIVLMNLDSSGAKRTVKVDPVRDPTVAEEPPPTRLRFLRWATSERVVYALAERIVPLPPVLEKDGRVVPNPDGPTIVSPIMTADADGRMRGVLVDAASFQETPDDARKTLADLLRTTKELQATRKEAVRWKMPHLEVLGFFPNDREQLVIATHGGYSMPRQHLVDIRTGSVREFGGDWPHPPGEPQVFDWFRLKVVGERMAAVHPATMWRDEELARVQRLLEAKFPRRVVEIVDWTETRSRVLCRVTGGSDPGRIFVFQRPEDLVLEVLRRTPWLTAAKLNETRFFQFDAPDGAKLSGYLTWPSHPRLTPPPLLVVFPSGFPGLAQRAFDPEAQVFADLGYVVARLNHRGVGGARAQDLTSLRSAVDRISVDDVRLAIDWIAERNPHRPFDRKRIAALGHGFGGYLAARALQLQPTVFRCGIVIDAPMDLRPWLRPTDSAAAKVSREIPAALIDHEGTDWKQLSVVEQAETLSNPLLIVVEPSRNAAVDASAHALCVRLQALGRVPGQIELEPGYSTAPPATRAAVYRKMEEFLNLHLNAYGVKIGPAAEVVE